MLMGGGCHRRTQRIVLTDRGRHKLREGPKHWRTAQEVFVSLYGANWSESLRATVLTIVQDDRLGKLAETLRHYRCSGSGLAGRSLLGCLDHLATLAPPDGQIALFTVDRLVAPAFLAIAMQAPIIQMVLNAPIASMPSPEHIALGAAIDCVFDNVGGVLLDITL
jgi:hypothetical protein